MKKVLIAIDYNPSSQKVVEAGYQLSQLTGAEVCLIHVMSDVGNYEMRYPTFMGYESFDTGAFDADMINEMRKVSEDFLKSAAHHLNDPKVNTHLTEGDAGRVILDYAEDWNADVIVMGTHSHSTIEKLLMGTIASTVLEKTAIPVYMIPIKKEK